MSGKDDHKKNILLPVKRLFHRDPQRAFFKRKDAEIIYAPFGGEVFSLAEIPDDNISAGLTGPGGAVFPDGEVAESPVDGRISFIMPTGHALGIVSERGTEIFLHIGINTAELSGEGFDVLVKEKEIIKRGDPLLRFDKDFIESNGYSLISPVLFPDFTGRWKLTGERSVRNGAPLLALVP